MLVFVNYYYHKRYSILKIQKRKKKTLRSTSVHSFKRFVCSDRFNSPWNHFNRRNNNSGIFECEKWNENVHNTDFVGLKNTRYIFFIERFANGIGKISFRSFPSFATRSPSPPPINQEDPKRFFAFARGQRKAWSSLETQTVVCTGPWRVIKGNGMEKRRGPRFAVSSEFESRRPTLTLLIPGARVPAGN